ncbi:hypothetical protein DICPUDRAFT_150970 [Dictyostelium purpureum]|uniref:PiggyBac transposable element-derived protein domain-containing protein n=1 Tax=Dictyostelium purpureum TaxID=5786 RepID=F0ZHP4_DICPU|nr:uncharacterized protein DICPUDRAFT_150970 [Dictyostelium purpureum]EGC36548.1 hypothetical protein DICPUDRAFT_150970 [Dictyostelium purpureum]|eukprot:XP_003286920.1 hypothetical protein DICPUDRAFT_150970 [Dictyostelium purpureum]
MAMVIYSITLIVNSNIIIFIKSLNTDRVITDISNNEYWYGEMDIDGGFFVLESVPEETGNEVDKETEEYEDENEIENQEPRSECNKDSEYYPQGVTFFQEQLNNINFMKTNILPREYEKQGPKESLPSNIPPVRDKVVQHIFEQYFTDFLNRLVMPTNNYKEYKSNAYKITTKNLASPKISEYSIYNDFNLEDIKIYLSIFLYSGLNRITNIHGFWDRPRDSYSSFSTYNSTVANLMSFRRFKAIHKCFRWEVFGTEHQTANHELIYEYAKDLIKKHYLPSYEFSFDLFGWSGDSKKMVPGKADKVGNVLWKLVDKFKYIYHFEIEHLVSKILKAQTQTQDENDYEEDMVDQPQPQPRNQIGN